MSIEKSIERINPKEPINLLNVRFKKVGNLDNLTSASFHSND
jgi:hypothetical protein